ncbi:Uncharacterised protein [Mycobacterium tuberculosis]|nr:Uncharacterised protein [Mycobacterium tuberculosis]
MPLRLSAATCLATDWSTWRLIQTKLLSSSSSFLSSSFCGMPSSLATCWSLASTAGSSRSMSSGMAQMLGAGMSEARISPLRSRMRPRLAGSSSVRW